MEPLGDILAKSPTLKKRLKAAVPLTRPQENFIEAATVIRMTPGDVEAAYMARELVQCTLPHRSPANIPVWRRTNGNLTLAIQQLKRKLSVDSDVGKLDRVRAQLGGMPFF